MGNAEAAELQARIEASLPQLEHYRALTVFDYPMPAFNANPAGTAPSLVDIRIPIAGVGLTGRLPPGAFIVVVPFEDRDKLNGPLVQAASSPIDSAWVLFQFSGATAFGGPLKRPMFVLRPGESVFFDKPLKGGITAFAMAVIGRADQLWTDSGFLPTTSVASDNFESPHPRAWLRIFPEGSSHQNAALAYQPVPWITRIDSAIGAAVPVGGTDHPLVYTGAARTVSIHFTDNVAAPAPIVGGETGDYALYWLFGDGQYAHNPADDLNAGGRGSATRAHDVEVYDVPRNATGLFLVKLAGNDFFATVALTE